MDHCEKEIRKSHPRDRANLCSLVTFCYNRGVLKRAYKKDLEEPDLYDVPKSCSSKKCGDRLELEWKLQSQSKKKPSILGLLWACYGYRYLLLGSMHLTYKITNTILEPYAMSNLISYFKDDTKVTREQAFYYAGLVMSLNVVSCVYAHNYWLILQELAIRIKTAFSSLLYRKCLKLTPSAMSNLSLGNIVTLVTKDVHNFQSSIWILNELGIGIVQACIASYLLYNRLGATAFAGIAILMSCMPIQLLLGKLVTNMRLKVGAKTDERLQLSQEVISAIRIVKMFTWENYFNKRITEARRKELSTMIKALYLKLIIILLSVICSRIGFYVLISLYLSIGHSVTAETLYYVMSCFRDLKHTIAIMIPYAVARVAELNASLLRINRVLNSEELHKHDGTDEITVRPKVEMKGVCVKIKKIDILKDISIKVENGLTLITGIVGSGKSSLLKTILQDYPSHEGSLGTRGRVSYASQDPWLFPSSIKQNILFGQKLNLDRYNEVIRVCALRYDLDLLDNGDETILSDKGLNLSKGQQARINLARAIYKESEIYLLDDSLTALDARIQEFIFNNCIKGFLKDKLVILVTQNPLYFKDCDNVVVMKDGLIISSGAPEENVLKTALSLLSKDDDIEKADIKDEIDKDKEDTSLLETEQYVKKKVFAEIKKSGSVDFDVYSRYLKFGGGFIITTIIVCFFVTAQLTDSYGEKLLSKWVDLEYNVTIYSNDTYSKEYIQYSEKSKDTFTLFTILIIGGIFVYFIKKCIIMNFTRNASLRIHKAMSTNIITSTMPFFDVNFIGNILNRFSQDLSNIDEHLPNVLEECIRVSFAVFGVILILASVNWIFIIAAMVFFIILIFMRMGYMPTGRSLKRLEAATRSPLIGHLNASLEGITTIRAYKAQPILKDEFDRYQDVYTSANYTLMCTSRAFGFWMDLLCSCFIAIILSKFMFFKSDETAGSVGLALTQVFHLASTVQWGVRQWAELENQMTSVERALEYTSLKLENFGGQVLDNWPKQGDIKYNNVSLTYDNTNEKVLKNITVAIEPQEKIGIVGRTGAGKSSIISSLFRLYKIEGSIIIDGVDIKNLALDFLRQSIAIIPQDPILFSGTMRSNIDPMGTYSDNDIWDALRKVNIKEMVPSLEFVISDNGTNFSSGQKQLICLARAIIRKNKIVVLDEATANMDPETDALLHDTIKTNFANCTVLIIAHRLHSVIECDKIMVLDKGKIFEYDSPTNLLRNKSGLFYKMVEHSGLLESL